MSVRITKAHEMRSLLYHGCCMGHLLSILRDDVLECGFAYENRGSAVSFSRNKEVPRWFHDLSEASYHPSDPLGGTLVVDRELLKTRFRIEPFENPDNTMEEFEEVVRRDIKGIDHYLVSILVRSEDIETARKNTRWQDKMLGEPLGFLDRQDIRRCLRSLSLHPKLNQTISTHLHCA